MGGTLPCGLGLPLRGCWGHCAQLPWTLQRKQAGGSSSELGGTAPFTPSSWSRWSLTKLREGPRELSFRDAWVLRAAGRDGVRAPGKVHLRRCGREGASASKDRRPGLSTPEAENSSPGDS